VRLRDRVEWAISKRDDVLIAGDRLEAGSIEDVDRRREQRGPARARPGQSSRLGPKALTVRAGSRVECLARGRRPGSADRERLGKQARGDLVVAGWKRQLEFTVRSAVELGRPPRSGAGPTGEPPKRDVEEAGLNESVQVEGSKRPADVESLSGGISTDGFRLIRNVGVQGAPDGLREDRDLLDGSVLLWVHAPILDRPLFYKKPVLVKSMAGVR